jgi:hypothetical protein
MPAHMGWSEVGQNSRTPTSGMQLRSKRARLRRPSLWPTCGARTRAGRRCASPGIGLGGRCIKHGGCAGADPVVLFDGYAPEDDPLDPDFRPGQLWLAPARVAAKHLSPDGWRPPVRGDGADWNEPARARWPHRIGTGVIRRILARQLQRVAYLQLSTPDGWDSLLQAIPAEWPSSRLPELATLIRVPAGGDFTQRWAREGWDALAAREWADDAE